MAALAVAAGGCGLDVPGIGSDVAGDVGPDEQDGEVPPPDDAGEDGRDDTAGDAEVLPCTTAADCDDGIPCTVDACAPGAGTCSHEPDDAACDDHDACTGAESCDPASGCVSASPIDCDDDLSCTDDLCDPSSGACSRSMVHDRCAAPQLCDPARATDATGCADPPDCATSPDCDDHDPCNGLETCGGDLLCHAGIPVNCDDTLTCTTDVCLPATGACEHVGPDADGDTYVDSTCFGTDCNDGAAGIHPGATESCDGVDDDCDLVPDDGATCAAPPNATAQCLAGSCDMTCAIGWDDCDGVRSNGCEASLSDPATCGSCTTPCAPPHAAGGCTAGRCGITSCDAGWGDCNTLASDGCERELNTLLDCGTCSVACAPANATGPDCADGSCGYANCGAGWLDCDSHPENGCELSAGTATACGTSCATVTNCTTLPHVTSATCTTDGCAIAGCVSGYAECNDRPGDGCERLLDNNLGTCDTAADLGSVRGDQGADVLTRTGFGEGWFAFDVTEAETSSYTELTATIALDVPAGIDYDVYVYCGTAGCTSVGGPSGANSAGIDETVNVRWNDASGYTNRTVYFEIRFYSGGTLACGDWTVTITGNTSVGSVTCP